MAKGTWLWLVNGLGFGAMNAGELLEACPGGAEQVAEELGSETLDAVLTQKQAERLAESRPADFAGRVAQYEGQGVALLPYDDEDYPAALRNISNPPLLLFLKGDAGLMNGQLAIGMVGARRPSAYGVEATKALGRGLALGGAIIVSGLAAGLDSEAHKAALAVNGPTVACIAFGHDQCYPAANRRLMEVIASTGAVVSEYPPATSPEKPYFLQRNRIIAGLSHGLVVVEARRHSGTMSTVNFAIDYGREVFAVPGSIFSELSGGTNEMIREGAFLAGGAADVLGVYGVELKGEDPVKAAARQAATGRPEPAAATPPWQQNLARFTEAPAADGREELPGQQSLGELLRSQARGADGRISAGQAVEAFRRLQTELPPTTDSELEARNRALDEMVAAVSDQVEIGQKATPAPTPGPPEKGRVEPYPWHKVERISKSEVEAAKPGGTGGKKPSLASRLFGTGAKQDKPPAPKPAQPAPPPGVGSRVERIGAVEAVGGVERIAPIAGVAPAQVAQAAHAAPPVVRADEKPPVPVRERRREAVRTDESLAARLNTLRQDDAARGAAPAAQAPPDEAPPAPAQADPGRAAGGEPLLRMPRRPAPKPPAAETPPKAEKRPDPADPQDGLSNDAQRAYRQLGATPVSLADICQKSGLTPAEAMAALTELELAGLSRQLAGRQFVIMQ